MMRRYVTLELPFLPSCYLPALQLLAEHSADKLVPLLAAVREWFFPALPRALQKPIKRAPDEAFAPAACFVL